MRWSVSFFAAFLLACGGHEKPAAVKPLVEEKPADAAVRSDGIAAPVRTDRSHYVLEDGPQGREATIVATLRAPVDRAVYLVNCNGASPVGLQRKVGEIWVDSWMITMNACLSPPIVVSPGGEHATSVYLHERSGAVLYPEGARMLESGTYRVLWTGVLTAFDPNARGFGPELPLDERVSAPITIETDPAA